MLIDLHNRGLVPTAVAVVRRGEDGGHVLVVRQAVAVHHQLMRAGNHLQFVSVVKLLADIVAESVPSTAGGDAPSSAVIGVGPQQIAHGTLVGYLLDAVQLADVVQGVD